MQQQVNLLPLAPTKLATLAQPYLLFGGLLTRAYIPASDDNVCSNQIEIVEQEEVKVVHNLCKDNVGTTGLDAEGSRQ